MATWDEVKEKVTNGSKVVADKAKEIVDIASLHAQVVSCEGTMLKGYKDLGKAFYEAHKDDAEFADYADIMNIIKTADDKKAELEKKIAEARCNGADDTELVDEPDDATFSDVAVEVADAPASADADKEE